MKPHIKNLTLIIALHIVCAVSLVYFFNTAFVAWSIFGFFVFSAVLNELYLHRYVSHKMFNLPKIFEWGLGLLSVLTLQGKPIHVASTHKYHHRYSDTLEDPHYDKNIFKIWFFLNESLEKKYSFNEMRKLIKNKTMYSISKHYFLIYFGLIALSIAISYDFFLYGICIPTILAFHYNSAINVLCHRVGYVNNYPLGNAKNNFLINMLGLFGGSALHANHHYDPTKKSFSTKWYEIDLCGIIIKLIDKK